eukprot:1156350-Pelagomonas_calceolata.AAC.22
MLEKLLVVLRSGVHTSIVPTAASPEGNSPMLLGDCAWLLRPNCCWPWGYFTHAAGPGFRVITAAGLWGMCSASACAGHHGGILADGAAAGLYQQRAAGGSIHKELVEV